MTEEFSYSHMASASAPAVAAVEAEQPPDAVQWSDLNGPALQLMLKHVPQRHRLGHGSCCALVCSSWAEAAAAATDSLVLEQCADTDSLQLWLHRHGSDLTQLHVSAASGMLTQLPCPKLTHLLLQGDSLLAAPALPSVLAGLPSLQHLSLHCTTDSMSCDQVPEPFAPGLLQQLPRDITVTVTVSGQASQA